MILGGQIDSPRFGFSLLSFQRKFISLLLIIFVSVVVKSEGNICGSITTKSGDTIVLRENETSSKQDFDKVQIRKLKNANFVPKRKCIIKVCGYTSYATQQDGCSGSQRDLMDCHIIKQRRKADTRYNDLFNASSISCGCIDEYNNLAPPCDTKCHAKKEYIDRASTLWKGNECAILYREFDCQECYFQAIKLRTGQTFVTDNSQHNNTFIVRDQCTVKHYISALKRLCQFPYSSGIVTYKSKQEEDTSFTTQSSFQGDPEAFTCTCPDSPPTTTTTMSISIVPESSSQSPSSSESSRNVSTPHPINIPETNVLQNLIPIFVVLLINITGSFVGFKLVRFWKRWKSSKEAQESTLTEKRSAIQNTGTNDTEIIEMKDLRVSKIKDQQIPADIIERLDSMQKYMERLFETSRQAEAELYVPAVIRTEGKVVTNDLDIATDQFRLICEPQFIIKPYEFVIGEKCGFGHFGIVYKGVLTRNDDKVQNVAIKRLKSSGVQEKVLNSFLREVKIFQYVAISHENIVRFYGACYHNGEFYILTKLCENGSLEHYLKKVMRDKILVSDEKLEKTCGYFIDKRDRSSPSLQPKELQQLLRWSEQIANGMDYLHLMKIIHLDLAVRNVLLSYALTAKIADLGLSRKCADGKDYARSLLEGTSPPNSFAPECISKNLENAMRMTVFVDVWAFGCTVWEIFTLGDNPYPDMAIANVIDFLKNGDRLAPPQLAPTYVYEKLLECWKEVPQQRPTFLALRKFFEEKRIEEEE